MYPLSSREKGKVGIAANNSVRHHLVAKKGLQLEEKIGRKSFAITRWGEGGAFWACIVNSVAVVTFPSSSDERAEKREREREREMEQREKVKWNEKQERGRKIQTRIVQPRWFERCPRVPCAMRDRYGCFSQPRHGYVIPVIVLFLRRHRRLYRWNVTVSTSIFSSSFRSTRRCWRRSRGDKGNTLMAIGSIDDVFTGNGMRL